MDSPTTHRTSDYQRHLFSADDYLAWVDRLSRRLFGLTGRQFETVWQKGGLRNSSAATGMASVLPLIQRIRERDRTASESVAPQSERNHLGHSRPAPRTLGQVMDSTEGTEKKMTTALTTALTALAVERLDATLLEDGDYVYQESPAGRYYRVDATDLEDLGRRLLAGEPDAYSLWCAAHGGLDPVAADGSTLDDPGVL